LLVLPEGTLPAYVLGDQPIDESAVAEAITRLQTIARRRKVVIVAGAAIRDGVSLYNAGIVIDRDGTIAGRADKVFLWHFDRLWFTQGQRIAPVETSIGRLGVLVCADGRMPEISRTLVDRGAEMLVMPTAWISSGRDPHSLENPIADLLGRLRAFENGVPFAAANKVGFEQEMVVYCGKSQIVDDTGATIALASERDEETLYAGVVIREPHPFRAAPQQPSMRSPIEPSTIRIAITPRPLPADIDRRLAILKDDYVIAPAETKRIAQLDATVPTIRVDDEIMLDPAGLPTYRRAGYRLAIWSTQREIAQAEMLARARAGENRMYVAVIDLSVPRAFVADPDYAVICGTFGEYHIASFALDIAKTANTAVVPGTDVAEGLERVHALASSPP